MKKQKCNSTLTMQSGDMTVIHTCDHSLGHVGKCSDQLFEWTRYHPRHWYKTTIYMCPLCGHEDVYRERVYYDEQPKPEDRWDRYKLIERGCGGHFL